MGSQPSEISGILEELKKYIVGYEDLLNLMAVALLSEGHILIEGPPGTGKTTIARLFSQAIGGSFKRIQMAHDLLPSDIVGVFYFDVKRGEWVLREGPIFANIVLVDELNRAPPRTQIALLEAMQERQVTIEGNTLYLPRPFLVIATQIPIGAEGTYRLTPVLIDRFAYSYRTSYPRPEEEVEIISRVDIIEEAVVRRAQSPQDLLEAQKRVRQVYVSEAVKKYIVDLVGYIRKSEEVLLGPSPRASIWLYKGGRALAFISGMDYVIPDHIKYLARYVLPHRILIKPEYEAEGVDPLTIVSRALEEVEVPKA